MSHPRRVRRLGATAVATVRTLRQGAAPLLAAGLLFAGLPTALLDLAISQDLFAGLLDARGNQVVSGLVLGFTQPLLVAFATYVVMAQAGGRRAKLAESLGAAWRCLLPLAGLSIATSIGATLGTVLLVLPGILLLLRWFVAIPVRMAEGPGLSRALGRSAALMRGTYGLGAVLGALYLVAAGAAATLVSLADGSDGDTPATPAGIALDAVTATALGIVAATAVATLYQQLRTGSAPAAPDPEVPTP